MRHATGVTTPPRCRPTRARAVARVALGAAALAAVVGLGGAAGASAKPTTIVVSQNKTWGPTLTLKDGYTVYRLTADSTDKSRCTGKCATVWLPVVLATGQAKPDGVGVSGLGSFTRPGGAHQVTYQGIPLYTFTGDKAPGQVTGNVKDGWGQWWSINPASPKTPPTKHHATPVTTTTAKPTTTTTTKPTTTTTKAPTPTTTLPPGGGVVY